jgi:hypothetical protein
MDWSLLTVAAVASLTIGNFAITQSNVKLLLAIHRFLTSDMCCWALCSGGSRKDF